MSIETITDIALTGMALALTIGVSYLVSVIAFCF